MKKWQMQEAKAKLSEVIQYAVKSGPQEISVRGTPTAVVLSSKRYIELTKPKMSFVKLLKQSPLFGIDLDLKRDKTPCREVEL